MRAKIAAILIGLSALLLLRLKAETNSFLDPASCSSISGGLENCDCIEEGPHCSWPFPPSCEIDEDCTSCRDKKVSLICDGPETDGYDCFVDDTYNCRSVWYDFCHADGYCWDGTEEDGPGHAGQDPDAACLFRTMKRCHPYFGPNE